MLGAKMKIHWNDRVGQIMTKEGKCLYDKVECTSKENELIDKHNNTVDRLDTIEAALDKNDKETTEVLEQNKQVDEWNKKMAADKASDDARLDRIERQLKCAAKGHGEWEFQKKDAGFFLDNNGRQVSKYIFKCRVCNLEITKSKKELSPSEREGLKKLKLL